MTDSQPTLPAADRTILRDLARRIVELSHSDVNVARRQQWYRHRRLEPGRPMILIEEGEIAGLVGIDALCRCTDGWAHWIEYLLRLKAYMFEVVGDDHVVEPTFNCSWAIQATDYGVQAVTHSSTTADGARGAVNWDPAIRDLDRDFEKLTPRTFSVDRAASQAGLERMQDLLGDILDVRLRGGGHWWTMGMTGIAIQLIGLEGLMLAMYDNPAGLHRLMAFLRDDHLAHAEFVEREGLLTPNNEDDYIGSGSLGYTHELPQADYPAGGPARLKDLWVLSESQETVGVSPEMFAEFIFPYQLALIEKFGLCYYGCCEPVNSRWHILKTIPNLRAVSVSPWADQSVMAEGCGREILFCRKPNPAMISTPHFDESAILADVRGTVAAAGNCNVEIVMKDIHTLSGDPSRVARWVALAREACEDSVTV